MSALLRRIEPFTRPAVKVISRLTRGMTLGVRGVIFDAQGRVLLVEHTYMHGWHLPGGGVERGETALQSLTREMVEEAGVQVTGQPRLMSIHYNGANFRGDHVLAYRIDDWTPCPMTAHREIKTVAWFDPAALPADATPATVRRVNEALGKAAPTAEW